MINIPVAEAKNRLSEIIARVEAGEEIAVTRRGKPVVRLVAADPIDTALQRVEVADVFSQLRELRRTVSPEGDLKAYFYSPYCMNGCLSFSAQ